MKQQQKQLLLQLHGQMYDLTDYVNNHPGGADILWELNKTDATCEFDDIGHSEETVNNLKQFEVKLSQPLHWNTINSQLSCHHDNPTFKNSFLSKCCAWFFCGFRRQNKTHSL